MKLKKFFAISMAITFVAGNFWTLPVFAKTVRNPDDVKNDPPIKIEQDAGRNNLGEFAPDFAHFNDDILFGEVWSRNDLLSLHDRSLITVTALIAMGIFDTSFEHHMQNAKSNGVTKDEMAAAITQLAFYTGWPKAWAAFRVAKQVYAEE